MIDPLQLLQKRFETCVSKKPAVCQQSVLKPDELGEITRRASSLSPESVEGLLSYQIPHFDTVAEAIETFGVALDASDTGTGKTYVAIALCRYFKLRPAIICPKSVITPWKRVCEAMGVDPIFILNYESLKTGKTGFGRFSVHKSGKKETKKFTFVLPFDAILVFDEVHRCSGRETDNSLLLISAKDGKHATLALSATCAESPLQLKALGYLLGLHSNSDYWKWARRNGCKPGYFGGMVYAGGREGLKKLHSRIFPTLGSRIRIADLGDAFPETQITADAYDIEETEELDAAYKQVIAEIREKIAEAHRTAEAKEEEAAANDKIIQTGLALTLGIHGRQIIEILKVPLLVSLAQEYVELGHSVAIFCCFDETLNALADKLHIDRSFIVRGGQHPEIRTRAIDFFQSDNNRIILLNFKAGGEGIGLHDTHGVHSRVSLICPVFHAKQLKQVFGRVTRAGGKTKSLQRIVFAANTIEEHACKAVRAKLGAIATLNDGDLQAGLLFNLTTHSTNTTQHVQQKPKTSKKRTQTSAED